ncbi:MAG: DUF4115 domain-containing protein, partial [Chloroflexi bacterium]|nr:DUF4115 domain-containing protein [Chloroflexota bacterium]
LEDESYNALPAPVYVRGLLRTLARHLRLNADELVGLYQATLTPDPSPKYGRSELLAAKAGEIRRAGPTADQLASLLVVMALVAVVAWGTTQDSRSAAPPVTAVASPTATAAPTPEPAAPAPATALPTTPTPLSTASPTATAPARTPAALEVRVEITSLTWMQVEVDARPTFQGFLQAGTDKVFTAQSRVTMRAGNGGGVTVFLNGQSQGVLGKEGSVEDRQWVWGDQGAVITTTPVWTSPPATATPAATGG